MLLVLGNSPREERHKEKQVPHFMVTEYIQRELKSAHQTPATLQETSTFRRLKAAALPIAAGLEEQRGQQDLVKMSVHPLTIWHVFPSSNVRGTQKLSFL